MGRIIALVTALLLPLGVVYAQEASSAGTAAGEPATDKSQSVEAALGSPLDQWGIPQGMYEVDRVLLLRRQSLVATQTTNIVVSSLAAVLVPGGLLLAALVPELVWAPYGNATRIPWGYFACGVGVVLGIYDLAVVLPDIHKQEQALKDSFVKRYKPE